MKYCANCGNELDSGVKFCPYCGAEVHESSSELEKPPKPKMNKGVTKSLRDQTNENIKTKSTKDRSKYEEVENIKQEANEENKDSEDALDDVEGGQSLPNNTIGIYFVLNIILTMWNTYSDEILGIFIYTWIVLAIIFIRRNKDNPFNWLLNIFISLQAILVFATGMMRLEYADVGGDGVGALVQLVLLVLLLITIVTLLYKGNRKLS